MKKSTEQVLEQINGFKFLAIDRKDARIIIIMSEVENGYNGFSLTLDNRGYSLSPFFIASTFIKNTESCYDFTNNFNEALAFLNNA
jgi:hypothetical protein